MMDLREKVFIYDMKKRGEEFRSLFNEYDKLLYDFIKEIEQNKIAKKQKVKTIRIKQKGFQLTIKDSGKKGIARKNFNDFVCELISDYTISMLFANEYYRQAVKWYKELQRHNAAYDPSVIKERNIFYTCNSLYRGYEEEIDGVRLKSFHDNGKKKKLNEILWEVVKAKKYKPYCDRSISNPLFKALYQNYRKFRVTINKKKNSKNVLPA